MSPSAYPGTLQHQRLLRAIAAHYADDPRVLAVCIFGSLGRGDWDTYSDLDLDVVTVDRLTLDVPAEVRRLCQALGETPAVLAPDRDDAADVVLTSLMQFSIRYHPLQTTSPNIVDSLVVLTGRIERADIVVAGLANRRPAMDLDELVAACVRHAATVDISLHRRRFWIACHLLHLAREQLLRLFAVSHGAIRPYQALDAGVGEAWLRARLLETLPQDTLPSIQEALVCLLDLLEHDVPALSAGRAHLTEAQRAIVRSLRVRQSDLDLTQS